VAKLVEAARVRDAAAGHEIAKELEGKVTRKVVKQTVMTIVYGVTFIGGRLQIERQLKDVDVEGNVLFKGSYYLVNKVFASIGEMFTAARGIQARFSGINTIIKSYSEQRAVPLFPLLIKQESPPPSPSKNSSLGRTPPPPPPKSPPLGRPPPPSPKKKRVGKNNCWDCSCSTYDVQQKLGNW